MSVFDSLSGTPFGTLTMNVVEMNGLGLNPNAILAGDAHGPLENGTHMIMDLHGAMTGEIAGTFNGSDYARVSGGVVISNIHGFLATQAGEKLAVKILGEAKAGEMRAEIRLRHYGVQAAVNDKTLLARGPVTPNGRVEMTIYESDVDAPFADPDAGHVDYANFPYTLEDLQNNPEAQSVYSGEGRLFGAESFGVGSHGCVLVATCKYLKRACALMDTSAGLVRGALMV